MYIIITYDAESKRTKYYLKLFRQYLTHSQKSVFEGHTTESKLKEMINNVKKIKNYHEDQVKFYKISHLKYLNVENINGERLFNSMII